MFNLTPAAAQQIQQAAQASGAAELALRVAAKKDADGDLQYGMGFDDPKDEDMKLDLEGVAVDVLALALVAPQAVGRGKMLDGGHVIHAVSLWLI